jgi:hypothetical protein
MSICYSKWPLIKDNQLTIKIIIIAIKLDNLCKFVIDVTILIYHCIIKIMLSLKSNNYFILIDKFWIIDFLKNENIFP